MQLLPSLVSSIDKNSSISFLGWITKTSRKRNGKIRGKEISMIFQEPGTSLNPVYTTGSQVMEAIILHQKVPKYEARKRAIELYRVGIPD